MLPYLRHFRNNLNLQSYHTWDWCLSFFIGYKDFCEVYNFFILSTICFICLSGHLTTIKSQNSASHLHGKGEVISEGTFKSVQSRGVSGYQILGGQTVMQCNVACRRRPVAPSILPKTGWAIAHPAHPPVTPLNYY